MAGGSGVEERHGDVAAALPGEPLAHLHQHRHRREPAGEQRLALDEPVGRPQHRLGREPEGLGRARRCRRGCSSASASRLSHWLRICGWIFEGRCDDSSSHRPYLRPSAAIWMRRSSSRCATGLAGSVPHRLWASSMTSSVGTRRSRWAHSSSTTSRQMATGSAGSPNPPRSITVTPLPPVTTSAAERQVAGPHLPVEHPEVLHPPGQRLLAGGARAQRREHGAHLRRRADLRQEADEGVVLVLVAHRVQLQRGGLGLAGHRAEPHPQRLVALGARGVAAQHPHAAVGDPPGVRLRHTRAASSRGARSRRSGRRPPSAGRSAAGAARASPRGRRSCPTRSGRTGRCAG